MKIISIVTFVISVTIFQSCKKNELNADSVNCIFNNKNLVGTWNFSAVKDSTGNNILSKVDDCITKNVLTFTLDSLKTSACGYSNNHIHYTTSVIDNKNYLVFNINNDKSYVSDFKCNSMTISEKSDIGNVYYTFVKK